MKRVYATVDPVEAEVLCALLRDAGIEPAMDDATMPLLNTPAARAIHVRDEDAAAAAEVLARHFEKNDLNTEDDPEAPEPPRPDESANFEKQIARKKSWRRPVLFHLGSAFWCLWIYYYAQRGDAAKVGLGVGGLVLWLGVDLVAGKLRKTKEPAP